MSDKHPILVRAARRPGFLGHDALTWLFLYRLVLASVLILMFTYASDTPWPGSSADPRLARAILAMQGVLILLSGLFIVAGWPSREHQIELAVFLDIGIYTLLMHVSGGVATGLGLLSAIAVTAGALLMEGRLSLLFASLATLAVIAQQVYAQLYEDSQSGTYTQAGLLGLTYFAVALMAHVLTARIRETETLAARRKVDIADLSKLNEYVIRSMSIGIVVVDGERDIVLLNHAARGLLGAPQAGAGTPLVDAAADLANWFHRELRGQHVTSPVLSIGEREVLPTLQLLGDDRSSGALIYLRDHRELARQAQEMKLASLGRLTASIAHNVRNPLSSVTHATQLLAESESLGQQDRHLLDIISRNARRIDETVTSVLALSGRHQAEPEPVELCAWLAELRQEYADSNRVDVQCLRLDFPDEPLVVNVDPRHLGQILRNLCDNAFRHGHADGEPARVVIQVRPLATRNPEVWLTVSDAGPGVPPEIVREIFEPFFTTSRHGSGLGLYAARELAEANGMRLEYIERDEPGASFRLTFID